MDSDKKTIVTIIVAVALLVGIPAAALPYYRVFASRLAGEAELAHAEYSKKVAVETAKAKKDSAVLEAEAEVLRAKGVAQANEIIGQSLNNNESYLHYLWIQNLHDAQETVVYIPTEANMPVMEANRLKK